MELEVRKIKSCRGCPFANYHYGSGNYNNCNLGAVGKYTEEKYWLTPKLPKTTVLKDCPLKTKEITFKLK